MFNNLSYISLIIYFISCLITYVIKHKYYLLCSFVLTLGTKVTYIILQRLLLMIKDKSVFKNTKGSLFLRELFYEMSYSSIERSNVIYTLKDEDFNGYLSLYRIYMKYDDPTEYKFAIDNFYNYSHWERLTECTWLKPYLADWRREADVKRKSEALARIQSEAKTGSREAFQANKYLLEKGWSTDSKRGRPSKEEIKQAANDIATNNSLLKEEAERLGIRIN